MTDHAGAPGTLRDDVDLDELRAEMQRLAAKVDRFAAPTMIPPEVEVPADAQHILSFVIMPFSSEDLEVVYEDFMRPVLVNKCGTICRRGDDIFGSSEVIEDVIAAIREAHLIVADLTGQNANVFYEVGIAHTLNKPVLLLAQSIDDVPFDLRHRRVLIYEYSPRGAKRLEEKLEANVNAMLSAARDH